MDYFITLNGKSIDAIGEAVEKPITVIDELKQTLAETIEAKDAIIAEKDEQIESLEGQLANAFMVSGNLGYIQVNNNTGSAITGITNQNAEHIISIGSRTATGYTAYAPNLDGITTINNGFAWNIPVNSVAYKAGEKIRIDISKMGHSASLNEPTPSVAGLTVDATPSGYRIEIDPSIYTGNSSTRIAWIILS